MYYIMASFYVQIQFELCEQSSSAEKNGFHI